MSGILERYQRLRQEIPKEVDLLAVSKTHGIEKIQELYDYGIRDFGENRVQELLEKSSKLPSDIRWHLIGHLQRNKVKLLLPKVYLIHSLDSERLFHTISTEAKQLGIQVSVLIQVRISPEETKFGMPPSEVLPFLTTVFPNSDGHVKLKGLMGMASFVSDKQIVRAEFNSLFTLFNQVKALPNFSDITTLSMGMSQDRTEAIQEGSTCIRIGSDIFGHRY
jgi:PLP dependent protein